MTPLPVADSFDALNARFLDACMKRRQAILRGQSTTIGERMEADTAAFMPLPLAPYDDLGGVKRFESENEAYLRPWRASKRPN
jgi:hypothetical protein